MPLQAIKNTHEEDIFSAIAPIMGGAIFFFYIYLVYGAEVYGGENKRDRGPSSPSRQE